MSRAHGLMAWMLMGRIRVLAQRICLCSVPAASARSFKAASALCSSRTRGACSLLPLSSALRAGGVDERWRELFTPKDTGRSGWRWRAATRKNLVGANIRARSVV